MNSRKMSRLALLLPGLPPGLASWSQQKNILVAESYIFNKIIRLLEHLECFLEM